MLSLLLCIVQQLSSNMQSPHDTSDGSSNQHPQQSSPSSRNFSSYVDHSGQSVGYRPVGGSAQAQVQRPTYGHIQGPHHPVIFSGNPAVLPIAQQPQVRSSVNPQSQYPSQHVAPGVHHDSRAILNPGVPAHFQDYRGPIENGQPIVPSQSSHAHFATQNTYSNPATWTPVAHAQYSDSAMGPSSLPTMSGYPAPPSSALSTPHVCDVCGAAFTRPQNLRRHRESQHTNMEHVCPYCQKSYTRVDSLKRHMDKPCDQMPRSAQGSA